MAPKVKRIKDGKTYNTETATLIAGGMTSEPNGPWETFGWLYQNRFGAFFRVTTYESMAEPMGVQEDIIPMTPEDARQWLEAYHPDEPEAVERLFGEMPEAGSGESKFTLRMPDALKDRLADLAKENSQSLNAWIVRCLEGCAQR